MLTRFFSSALFCLLFLLPVEAFATQSITLSWEPNSEATVAGYRLYSGTISGVYTTELDVGNMTTATVSNLIDGTEYFFVITAYNTVTVENPQELESSPSVEISYVAPATSPTPTPNPTPTPAPTSTPLPPPTPIVDLTVAVTDGTTIATPGAKTTYQIVVTNVGANVVTGALVEDIFPATFKYITYTARQAGGALGFTSSGNGNISDTVTMWPGSTITYQAKGTIQSSATATLSNTATVIAPSNTTDANISDNIATDTDTLSAQADLIVRLDDGRIAASPGSQNTYNIVVTNFGPSDVIAATVRDTFPLTFTAATFSATESGGAAGFTSAGSGSINDIVTMPVGSKLSYKVHGTISTVAGGSISNAITVTAPSGVTDPDLSNNTVVDTDTLSARADLNVRVDDGKVTASLGERDTYNVVVTNYGPSAVTGAVIKDNCSSELTNVTFTASQSGGALGFTFNGSGDIYDVVTMPPGSKISYKVHATITRSSGRGISNSATVVVPNGVVDANPANNRATDIDRL